MDKKYTPIPFSKKIFPFVLTVLSSIFFLISLHTYTNLGIFLESDAVYSDRIFGIMLFATVCLIVFLLYRETFESEKTFFAMVVAMGSMSYFVATLRFIYLTAAVFLVLAILKNKLKTPNPKEQFIIEQLRSGKKREDLAAEAGISMNVINNVSKKFKVKETLLAERNAKIM